MNELIIFPIILPLFTTILILFASHRLLLQRWLNLGGNVLFFIVSTFLFQKTLQQHYIVYHMGSWATPFGIVLISDILSSLLVLISSFVALCVAIFSFTDIDHIAGKDGFYVAYNILFMGLSGAFLTGDLFNLYVWFEVMLMSSFVLLTLNADKNQLEGAVKYAILNLIATLMLLMAIAFLYGITGTLNMADLSLQLQQSSRAGLITTTSVVFIFAFGMKAAMFPLFFWLPASYHTPNFSTSAVFAGLLTKVGVYALLRTFTLLFFKHAFYLHQILLALSLATLIVGILGAIAQHEIRRILSFSLISHIGFMTLGLALFTPLALIGSIFYLVQHILVKTHLFLSAGLIHYFAEHPTLKKSADSSIYQAHPFFAILFFISAFSLAGIPPFSGFWGKLILLEASLTTQHYFTAGVILITSLLTVFIVARLWQRIFLREMALPSFILFTPPKNLFCLFFPLSLLTTAIIFIGFFPAPIYHLSELATQQLLDSNGYIQAVLGPTFSRSMP